jgi:hypothetical protein
VADLAHLLAELVENATTFSPPTSEVRVRNHVAPGGWSTHVLSIEDTGIGMSDEEMAAANLVLAEPPDVDLRRSSMLGFHVVSRLAKRYGLQVRLAGTPGGGVTALVTLPNDLVRERRAQTPAPAPTGVAGILSTVRAPVRAPVLAGAACGFDDGSGPWTAPADVAGGDSWPEPEPESRPGPARAGPASPSATDWPDPVPGTALGPPPHGSAGSGGDGGHRNHSRTGDGLPWRVPGAGRQGQGRAAGDDFTADGLARRVPGAGLAPSLRRPPIPRLGPDSGGRGTPAAAPPPPDRDRHQVRAMLSRFQANQRAGRAAADDPAPPSGPQEAS